MLYKVIRNDITKMTVDAIVLPANPKLAEGPGASAAIFEKAGRKQLTRACKLPESLTKKHIMQSGMQRYRHSKNKQHLI